MTLYNVHGTVHDAVQCAWGCAWLCIWLCARRWVGDVHGAVQCIHVTMHGAVLGIVRDIVQYMALYSIDVARWAWFVQLHDVMVTGPCDQLSLVEKIFFKSNDWNCSQ